MFNAYVLLRGDFSECINQMEDPCLFHICCMIRSEAALDFGKTILYIVQAVAENLDRI